jgi:hypothetical protein
MNNVKALTRAIIEHPNDYDWSLQGFGMLRLYLEDNIRMHIWDSRYRVKDVSMMHDHPWDFHSHVVVGKIVNQRFVYDPLAARDEPNSFMRQTLLCGVGGGLEGGPVKVWLNIQKEEIYEAKDSYDQLANEIHISYPEDGTITLVRRIMHDDTEHAHVFWDMGKEWVTAEPRPATPFEVMDITRNSLAKWFT